MPKPPQVSASPRRTGVGVSAAPARHDPAAARVAPDGSWGARRVGGCQTKAAQGGGQRGQRAPTALDSGPAGLARASSSRISGAERARLPGKFPLSLSQTHFLLPPPVQTAQSRSRSALFPPPRCKFRRILINTFETGCHRLQPRSPGEARLRLPGRRNGGLLRGPAGPDGWRSPRALRSQQPPGSDPPRCLSDAVHPPPHGGWGSCSHQTSSMGKASLDYF